LTEGNIFPRLKQFKELPEVGATQKVACVFQELACHYLFFRLIINQENSVLLSGESNLINLWNRKK
jgi:hypothetical protein